MEIIDETKQTRTHTHTFRICRFSALFILNNFIIIRYLSLSKQKTKIHFHSKSKWYVALPRGYDAIPYDIQFIKKNANYSHIVIWPQSHTLNNGIYKLFIEQFGFLHLFLIFQWYFMLRELILTTWINSFDWKMRKFGPTFNKIISEYTRTMTLLNMIEKKKLKFTNYLFFFRTQIKIILYLKYEQLRLITASL